MTHDEIKAVILKHMEFAVDGVSASEVYVSKSMKDYGASSLDIVSVVSSSMREMQIKIPRPKLKDIQTIGELVDAFEKHAG